MKLQFRRNSLFSPVIASWTLLATLTANLAAAPEVVHRLYKSTDQGVSWSAVGQGLPAGARINALTSAGQAMIAGTDRGIFVSRDEGITWQAPAPGIGTAARILCLATHAGRVLAGTHAHGVMASDDEGATWKAVGAGLTDSYVRSLLSTGTRLYAGTDGQGVFVSGDAGVTWTQTSQGLPSFSQVFDMAAVDGTVFAGLYSNGVFRWDAERKVWVKAGDVPALELTTIGTTLVAGLNPGGVRVSTDRGVTWQDGSQGLPPNAPIWVLDSGDDRVFVGTSGKVGLLDEVGLLTSSDQGSSWLRGDAGLPPHSAAVSFAATKSFVLAGVLTPSSTR